MKETIREPVVIVQLSHLKMVLLGETLQRFVPHVVQYPRTRTLIQCSSSFIANPTMYSSSSRKDPEYKIVSEIICKKEFLLKSYKEGVRYKDDFV